MARTFESITSKVESLRRAAADRDQRHRDVHDVRSGDIDTVIPGSMPDAWPKPIVANAIDTSARDRAEMIGVMPSINCSAGVMTTQKAKAFASKRTKIAASYIQESGLRAGRQITAADHLETYGIQIYMVEPDFANKRPHIRVENPMGVYPEKDLFGRLMSITKVYREEAIRLVAKYPKLIRTLQGNQSDPRQSGWAEREVELVKYQDADSIILYLPNHGNQIVEMMDNPLGKVFTSIGCRPSYDGEIRGAFDDVLYPYLASSRMALLGLEATEKSVRAPLVVPRDVQQMTFGDDAVIRTDGKVTRAGLDYPTAAFQQGQILDQAVRSGTRTPEARSGNIDASIITGRGVQALQGGYNAIITTGQTILAESLAEAIRLCFEMDEKLWPNEKKEIRGTVQGTPFSETYTPSKDIAGDYSVDVTYGFAAGQDPARAIVGMLQLRGDQLISRDFFQRQLPMEIDVAQMQIQIDNEQITDAAKQGLMGYAQAIPQMALQGQDPTEAMERISKILSLREKGKSFTDAMVTAFAPKENPAGAPQNPLEALMGGGAGAPPGGAQTAPGAPPGGQQPQGLDLQTLLSGLKSNGETTSSVRTQRQSPV